MAEGNSVFDEIRAQHKKMKGKSVKEKAAYFWEYYRVATIVAILVIAFAANLIYTIVTAKDSAFHGVLINGYTDIDVTSFMEGFESFAQIDTNKYSTSLETNFTLQQDSTDQYTMANIQKFAAMVAAKELDVVIIDPDTFATYADGGYLYLCIGYGKQETGGYSIAVNDLYETANAIYLDTSLIGPKEADGKNGNPSYPYLVIKTPFMDKTVVFD